MEITDLEDYLDTPEARPNEPKNLAEGNVRVYRKKLTKPSKVCKCGQKLSIANTEKSCFSCRRSGGLDYTQYFK